MAALCALTAFAQLNTATLRVKVLDPNGAVVPQARIELAATQGKSLNATTRANGEATISKLTPNTYNLTITAKGFAPFTQAITITPNANEFTARLAVATVEETLTVEQDKRAASSDPRGDAFSNVLTAEQIALLPDDPDEFEQAIRNMAGPGAVFRVNGFRGGKLPPKNQIAEIRFRTNQFAAENHEPSHMFVDIRTKPGFDRWHGSLNAGFRDEALNARNPLAPFRAPEQNRRFGFELSGPLWRERTSLALSADAVNAYDAQTIVSQLPDRTFRDVVRRPWRSLNLNARLEHQVNKLNTLRGEYQRNAKHQTNLGVGNFDLAERAYGSDAVENLLRVSDSTTLGKRFFNDLRFQARRETISLDSLSQATTIQVLNAFTQGGAQLDSTRTVREIELNDDLDFAFGKHALRTGAQLEHFNIRSDELRNQNGTFTFASLADFRANRPLNFTQRLGAGRVAFDQVQLGWYAQDDWRVCKSLTLSLGLRHETQTQLGAASDGLRGSWAPRFGFAWSPFRNGKTALRGGAGIYYDWLNTTLREQALRVNGAQQRDLIIRNPGFPNPLAGGTAVQLSPSRIQLAAQLPLPRIEQFGISAEREIAKGFKLSTNYYWRHGVQQLRGRNLNAPLADGSMDGTRPDKTIGNLTQIEAGAQSFTHQFHANFNWMKLGKFMLSGNYILMHATNETDSPLLLPMNSNDLRAERGRAISDIRHRFFMFGNYTLPRGWRLSSILNMSSAQPYNITSGQDENGDGIANDRPRFGSGFGLRNPARGRGQIDLGTRLAWGFGFGKAPEQTAGGAPQVKVIRADSNSDSDSGSMLGSFGSLPTGGGKPKRYRLEFFIQASNLLNRTNLTNFSGVQTSPFFGQATAALSGRRLETGTRFSF